MSQPQSDEPVERGAAEDNSDAPLTDMEREVSRPPGQRWADSHDTRNRTPNDPAVDGRAAHLGEMCSQFAP